MGGKNKSATIYVVHEIQGGHIVRGFTEEVDAWSYLHHEAKAGVLSEQWYTVSPLVVENMSLQM